VTHYHADHSSNLRWLRDEFGADVRVFEQGIPLLRDRLPDTGVRPFLAGSELGPSDDVRLRTIHTPGHSADSVCLYLESEGCSSRATRFSAPARGRSATSASTWRVWASCGTCPTCNCSVPAADR
jgi:hypothetical protein